MNSLLLERPGAPTPGGSIETDPLPNAEALTSCPSLALWWYLARAYHAVHLRLSQFFDEHGMTGAQFGVLRCLGEAGPEGLMLSALSERLLVTCGNITGVVDRLEQGGLLRRERSVEDRRVVMARLTPRGQALYRQVVPEFRAHLAELLGNMGNEDQRELARLCEQLHGQVGRGLAARDAGRGGEAASVGSEVG
jgi:DNA-binding MarR family transcriptional regulator